MNKKRLIISIAIVFVVFALYTVFVYHVPCGPSASTLGNYDDYHYKPPFWFSFIEPIRDILGITAQQANLCPVCLSSKTSIDTPSGLVPVKDIQVGMPIWTIDKVGHRVVGTITKTSKVLVPPTHQMVHLVLDDGRELFASSGHPTIDERLIGDLLPGDIYNGVRVTIVKRVPYSENATYDILPSGETGFYWANGVLIASTLR